ncbi:MAG: DNA metabolism protein [Lachnospiraceae bacterium]|nr:DNA metabolism protein [Lachnospiraceae bacterium]
MDKEVVFVCENSFDGMMTAVYDAWVEMLKGSKVHIRVRGEFVENFLYDYIYVITDFEKARKVSDSIKKKISVDAYMKVYRACMHFDEERIDSVIDFLKIGYKVGGKVTRDYGNPLVMRVIELDRKVGKEAHNFKGVLRFKEIEGGVLISKITPKCDVLTLIEHHFSNRFPLENFVIYDEKRKKALVHKAGGDVVYVEEETEKIEKLYDDVTDSYEELFKIFFDTIGIESRKNERCQNNLLPKWYRKHMGEFKSSI